MVFEKTPGWLDWYDTAESQALLGYQRTTFADYCALLAKAVEEAIG